MKLTFRRALLALLALAAGAVPAIALAQSPYRDYRDAANDQYTNTNPTVTIGVTTPAGTVGVTVSGSGGPPTKTTPGNGNGKGNGKGKGNGTSGNGTAQSPNQGGNAPSTASGAAGTAAGANALSAANPVSGASCTWQPYAWIAFGPARAGALKDARDVTGNPMYAAQIGFPLAADALRQATQGTRWSGAATDDAQLRAFAHALGRSLVNGGKLARRAFPLVAENVTAADLHPAAGFILTEDIPSLTGADKTRTAAFVDGLLAGMRGVKIPTTERGQKVPVPIVGVEPSSLHDTTVPFFKQHDISSVDDVNAAAGRRSLSRTLAGTAGNWGTKQPSSGAADQPTGAAPLLCRPTATYQPGDLIRRSATGVAGGGRSTGILVILGLLTSGALLALVERRTRGIRRRAGR